MEKKVQELEKRIEILEAELKEYKAQVKYLLGFKKGINEQKRLF